MKDFFKEDEYWKERINKPIEDDFWIEEYKELLKNQGLCLDLGCGIGQHSKWFMENGYDVISTDISDTALEKVKEFNPNVMNIDMRNPLPFEDKKFDVVFAALSIHFFTDEGTKKLINEIKRVLKPGGLFIGSVNAIQGLEVIKDTAKEIEPHYYFYNEKYVRLFDVDDVKHYLSDFDILKIDEKETIRHEHKKNFIVFVAKKG